MQANKVIQIASKGLTKNKLRSLLTMLGVIIGVAAVIIMISISSGTEAAIEEQITGLGTNLVFVQSSFTRGGFGPGGGGQTGGLVYDDAFAIAEEINGVTAVVVEQPSSETVKVGDTTLEDVAILGTTADFPSVRDMTIESGRYFNQTDIDRTQKVAVLGSTLAEELFGDTPPVGQLVTVGNTKLTVVGVFEEKGLVGSTDFDSRIYIPITVVFQKFTPSQFARIIGDRVRIIYVEVDAETPLEDIILQTELLLTKRHDVSLEEPDFTIQTQQDIIQTQEATTAAFRSLLTWVAAVSLLVGGIGIMNIMLGFQFLTEALLLSLVGGLIGVAVGIGGAYIFGQVGEMRTVIVPSAILLAFTSAAAVGIFFGFYPANKASQLDPIEALRHE
jgi:putative ABC transport system permease protein